MQMTDGELVANFKQINEKLDLITQNQQKTIDDHDNKITENTKAISNNSRAIDRVGTKIDNHLDAHAVIKSDSRFTKEMWIMFGLCMATIIGSALIANYF